MRRGVVLVVLAVVATLGAVAAGVLTQDEEKSQPASTEKPFATTALTDFDLSGVRVGRRPFCEGIDDRQVDAALGSVPDALEWSNGDDVDVTGGGADVVHEFGCSYTVPDVGTARAWVFAPPVDAAQAQRLVKSAGKAPGCQAGTGPAFGSPTLTLSCPKDGAARASYRGLFGDAWLVCEVERRDAAGVDVADLAGRWCVGVLQAMESVAKG